MTPHNTTSIPEAAFLMVKGHQLRGIQPSPHNASLRQFVFSGEAATDALAFHDDADVPAKRFYRAVNDLRAILHPRPTTPSRRSSDAHLSNPRD
jgi:hypothetical protein